tara:strand:+ start:6357 stop:6632 length:276 start_codon:yes stop_codon:yes gene_type:complete
LLSLTIDSTETIAGCISLRIAFQNCNRDAGDSSRVLSRSMTSMLTIALNIAAKFETAPVSAQDNPRTSTGKTKAKLIWLSEDNASKESQQS